MVKRKGFPFVNEVLTPQDETLRGFYPALVQTIEGNSKALDLFSTYETVNRNSRDIGAVYLGKETDGDSRDIGAVCLGKGTKGDSRDIGIFNGFNSVGGNSYGIEGGLVNKVKESASGVKAYLYNSQNSATDFLIEIGAINRVKEEPSKDAFLMLVGLYNVVGDSAYPLVNIRGLKNFVPRLKGYFKKHYSRKDKALKATAAPVNINAV